MERKETVAGKDRQAALKQRRYQAGFRQVTEWVHDAYRGELKAVAKELRARAFADLEKGKKK